MRIFKKNDKTRMHDHHQCICIIYKILYTISVHCSSCSVSFHSRYIQLKLMLQKIHIKTLSSPPPSCPPHYHFSDQNSVH